LTVKPKTRFLIVVSAAGAEGRGAELALAHLLDALEQWGVGAKSRAGYGRLQRCSEDPPREGNIQRAIPLSAGLSALRDAVAAVLEPPDKDKAPPIAQRLDDQITDALLEALAPGEYATARTLLKRLSDHAGLKKRRKERLDTMMSKVSP
jgi:hypothetical protein